MLRSLAREFKIISNDLFFSNRTRSFSSSCSTRKLEGKVALITGAANGLGKATAQEFIQHGAHVIIADIDPIEGPKAADQLGPSAKFVQCDVSIESQVEEAVNFAVSEYGKLDILYNNAGITGAAIPASIADLDIKEFERVMKINVGGVIAGIKHGSRVMVPKGTGSILCTSSISGIMGGIGPHPYSISKYTIAGIVRCVASEVCGSGVRVNCISPGPVATAMSVAGIGQIYRDATTERVVEIINGLSVLKGAKCEEIDVARAALFLASDDSKYITGHNLVVDGGFTCFKNLHFPNP